MKNRSPLKSPNVAHLVHEIGLEYSQLTQPGEVLLTFFPLPQGADIAPVCYSIPYDDAVDLRDSLAKLITAVDTISEYAVGAHDGHEESEAG